MKTPFRSPVAILACCLPLINLSRADEVSPPVTADGGGASSAEPQAASGAEGAATREAEGASAVVYLHPYELDPFELDEIEWPVPPRLRLTQGLNRRRTRAKLEQLLRDFRFAPAAEVLKLAQPVPAAERPLSAPAL